LALPTEAGNCKPFPLYLSAVAEAGNRFRKIRRRHKLLGLLRLFRIPNLLLILLGQLLVIWRFAPIGFSGLARMDFRVWLLLLSTQAAAAAGYIINDYHDVKIDLINKPGRVVVGRLVTRRKALFSYLLLNLISLIAALAVGKGPVLAVASCIFILWLYSVRLKCTPLAGNLAVALLVAFSLFLPALLFSTDSFLLFQFCQFAFFTNLIRELIKDLEDMKGDVQYGCRTFPNAFGIPASRKVIHTCGGLLFCSLIGLLPDYPLSGTLLLVLVSPSFAFFFVKLQKADKKRDFHQLSRLLKWTMLVGIFGILLLQ